MGTVASLGIAAIGLILAGITVVLVRHNRKSLRAHKTAAFLAVAAGLCLVSVIVAFTGGLTSTQIEGMSVVFIIDVIGGVEFILNVRGHSYNPVWTPVLGFVLGVSLSLTPGALGGIAHHAQNAVVTGVHTGSKVSGG